MITKQDAQSYDLNIIDTDATMTDAKEKLIQQIKNLMPNLVNSDGQVDVKSLNDLFDLKNTTSNNQGYELTFAGKGLARAKVQENTTKELKVEKAQSKNFDTTENVIIRGDNIDTLKILYKNYHNKIKMIYIDPPYNTKSENFIYNDNFKQSEAQLIKDFGLNDQTIEFLDNIYGTRSHSGWLSFMYPRLQIARDLLTDDGVIFISIDDHEQANLKIICDEIFGESNFINHFIWKKNSSGKTVSKQFPINIDHILMYSKSNKYQLNVVYKPLSKATISMYNKNDNDERGNYRFYPLQKTKSPGPETTYDYVDNNGKKWVCPEKGWRMIESKLKALENDGRLELNGKSLQEKAYWNERDNDGKISDTLWDDIAENNVGTSELKKLFEIDIFSNPKPIDLINRCLNIITNSNDLILDFFAGSGTTAHAVMELNAEDGGNRKFILCQLDESIDPKKTKPAFDFCTENNFDPVISSITIERVNRAGDKIKKEHSDKNVDIGYKVFSLTDKPRIDYDDSQKTFNLHNKRPEKMDTLINMLVATCKTLDTKIESVKEGAIYKADNEIYIIDKVTFDDLKPFKDLKINIDSMADISLEDYLNLDLTNKDNITIIY